MGAERILIVNADDFGLSGGVNRGIIEAYERGIVTSTSLMVRWESAVEAVEYARSRPGLSLGLHVDLGEWVYRGGEWVRLYEVVPWDDEALVGEELERQLDCFQLLVGNPPTHLDSHQHVHRDGPLQTLMIGLASRIAVPLRNLDGRVRYRGDFFGQTGRGEPYPEGISVEALCGVLRGLPEGVTELGCHPGAACDHDSPYAAERLVEVATLCDPRVRQVIEEEGIRLAGFKSLPPIL